MFVVNYNIKQLRKCNKDWL